MKKTFSLFILIMAVIFALPSDVDAQRRRKKKKRRDKDKVETVRERSEIMEKLWFGLNIGNPSIGNNALTLGLGPMAAYKFNRFLSAGIITDFNYLYIWRNGGSNEHYLDISAGVFGRARFLRTFYAHAEYNYTSLDRANTSNPRSNFPVMFLGGGYTSQGYSAWGYEATLLFDVLGNLGQVTGRIPIEYRLGLTYNF